MLMLHECSVPVIFTSYGGTFILPNGVPLIVMQMQLMQLIIEARHVLSFMGLGDPTAKSWGTILLYAFVYPTILYSYQICGDGILKLFN